MKKNAVQSLHFVPWCALFRFFETVQPPRTSRERTNEQTSSQRLAFDNSAARARSSTRLDGRHGLGERVARRGAQRGGRRARIAEREIRREPARDPQRPAARAIKKKKEENHNNKIMMMMMKHTLGPRRPRADDQKCARVAREG